MTLNRRFYRKLDFWFGIGLAAVLFVFWTQIGRIKDEAAKVAPSIVIVAAWVCCLVIALKAVLSPDTDDGKKKTPLKQTLLLLAILLFSVAMILMSKVIGMYTCLFLVICSISLSIAYMEGNFNKKGILFALLYDVITIVVIFLLFHVFLHVSTPNGILI